MAFAFTFQVIIVNVFITIIMMLTMFRETVGSSVFHEKHNFRKKENKLLWLK